MKRFSSHRLSQDQLSKKVRSAVQGNEVDLASVPTFFDPFRPPDLERFCYVTNS